MSAHVVRPELTMTLSNNECVIKYVTSMAFIINKWYPGTTMLFKIKSKKDNIIDSRT